MALTTHIEDGLELKKKNSCCFLRFNHSLRHGRRDCLFFKLLKIIPCKSLFNLLNIMLSNRLSVVHIHNSKSNKRILNNGLLQNSVLALLFFNLYTSDIPDTLTKQFIYAYDIISQETEFYKYEQILNANLHLLDSYFKQWRQRPNPS